VLWAGEERVDIAEQAQILDERVRQRTLDEVRRARGEVGWLTVVATVALLSLAHRLHPDHDEPAGTKIEPRLDRRVETRAAVHVPAPRRSRSFDANRREQQRNGRGRHHVSRHERRAYVLDDVRAVQWALLRAVREDDAPTGARSRRDDGGAVDDALGHVAPKRAEVDQLGERALERSGVEQAREPSPRHAEQVPGVAQNVERRL